MIGIWNVIVVALCFIYYCSLYLYPFHVYFQSLCVCVSIGRLF